MYIIIYLVIGLMLLFPGLVVIAKNHGSRGDNLKAGQLPFAVLVMIIGWIIMAPIIIYWHFKRVWGYNPVKKMWWSPDYQGYWLVDGRGHIFAFGSAIHHPFKEGKLYGYQADELTINPSGRILCADGTTYLGDVFEQELLAPIVGVLPTEERDGYYVFTQAGEVFAFGEAVSYGSLAEVDPTQYMISWRGCRKEQQQPEVAKAQTPIDPRVAVPAPA